MPGQGQTTWGRDMGFIQKKLFRINHSAVGGGARLSAIYAMHVNELEKSKTKHVLGISAIYFTK